MNEELCSYLIECGYNVEDAETASGVYERGGIEDAVNTFRWADDEEHDCTGEMRDNIREWENTSMVEEGWD